MNVCILAGGLGTRLLEETEVKPKPMVEIGGDPMLLHIMNIYAAFGHNTFTLALGYKGELIKNYFLQYPAGAQNWKVHCIDTGAATGTGGRIKRLAPVLGKQTFMLTYGDGVSNVDLKKLLAFHRSHGKIATMLAVRPPARFGALTFQGDMVSHFTEKPQTEQGWINGGFFILGPEGFSYIDNDATMFEQAPLEQLARKGQLAALRHDGFWQCMDTLRDVRFLNNLWERNEAPWKVW